MDTQKYKVCEHFPSMFVPGFTLVATFDNLERAKAYAEWAMNEYGYDYYVYNEADEEMYSVINW